MRASSTFTSASFVSADLSSIYANIFYVSIRLLLDFDLYENIFDAFI